MTTATGAAGANFQACAALLEPGDDVLMERPGYDPLLGAARLLDARTQRFERTFDDGYALDPDRVRAGMTSRTRLVILTSPHNPTQRHRSTSDALREVGRLAEGVGAYVLVDEVYLDAAAHGRAARGGSWRSLHLDQQPDEVVRTLEPALRMGDRRARRCRTHPTRARRDRRQRIACRPNGWRRLPSQQIDVLLERSTSLLAANGRRLRAFLEASPELEYLDPGGGTVVFPRIKGIDDATVFAGDCWRSARPQSSRATSSRRRRISASGLAARPRPLTPA